MKKKHKNLLFIGPIPEPKGGVSIHIDRLSKLLKKYFNIKYIDESPIRKPSLFNIRSKNLLGYINIILWSDVVHIHSGVTLLRILHLLTSKILLKKTIVTLHAFSHSSGYQVLVNRLFLKLADKIVVVNHEIPNTLSLERFIIKPAFVPPDLDNETELPEIVNNWLLHQKSLGNIILAGNAFRIDLHNGVDLYGIDLCIDAMNILINNLHMNIGLIFILASYSKSHRLFNQYQSLIKGMGLAKHILLLQEDLSFVKLIQKCDIVLRPTCTDGDALTVREAIFLEKPIITSDVVSRPNESILFKNRDKDDLVEKIIFAINKYDNTKFKHEPLSNLIKFYMDIYLS